MDGWMAGQTETDRDRQTDNQRDGDRWINLWIDGRTDKQINGWNGMNGKKQIDR